MRQAAEAPSPIPPHQPEVADVGILPERVATLPTGRGVHVGSGGDDCIVVTAPGGRVELTVRFGPAGPILEFDAAAIKMQAKQITLACDELRTQVAGDMRETVRGRRVSESLGPTTITAQDLELAADGGELRASAIGDLHIDGDNVFINS